MSCLWMMKNSHLYVHIPFCNEICSYCDFTRCRYSSELVEKYLDAMEAELEERVRETDFETIYIGGGTPSSLEPRHLKRLMEMLKGYSRNTVEYTFEANPDSLNPDKIDILSAYGVNRISLGVQSTEKHLLDLMNRRHDFTLVKEVIAGLKRAGIDNISVDLIYSLPEQTMEDWKNTIARVLELDIRHVSLYSLTIEENSRFGREGYTTLDPDTEAEMYFHAIEALENAGILQYEVANFAQTGYESRHNTGYWNYDDFYGIGLGASSKIDDNRYDNTRNFITYFSHEFVAVDYKLSKEDRMFEMVMMGLRMKRGVDRKLFFERYNTEIDDRYHEAVDLNLRRGNLVSAQRYLRCSDRGLAILNTILEDFLDIG